MKKVKLEVCFDIYKDGKLRDGCNRVTIIFYKKKPEDFSEHYKDLLLDYPPEEGYELKVRWRKEDGRLVLGHY